MENFVGHSQGFYSFPERHEEILSRTADPMTCIPAGHCSSCMVRIY